MTCGTCRNVNLPCENELDEISVTEKSPIDHLHCHGFFLPEILSTLTLGNIYIKLYHLFCRYLFHTFPLKISTLISDIFFPSYSIFRNFLTPEILSILTLGNIYIKLYHLLCRYLFHTFPLKISTLISDTFLSSKKVVILIIQNSMVSVEVTTSLL